ncbi:hypothetical protein LMG28688_00652 [Paraburkholderia caffeinitolerans]|uniref:Uncharacterized protein n=1 Tax=Paraburkholderia caffeinitolerans TaxID=1723730 RepID=A0A6J5FG81_9BURK|nr:hypothetical protein LMG28688_00652 [Paraburkholderia caffeinitolerans]
MYIFLINNYKIVKNKFGFLISLLTTFAAFVNNEPGEKKKRHVRT